jgi:Flp pilus assembly protein TadB
LSSAILYVAIVAIWAGVLIPRWLRRDSAASQRASEDLTRADAETSAPAEVAAEPAPPPRRRDDTGGSVAPPARPQEQTKVLASRRRLLYMLVVLALGSGALAVTKMAAWWVVVPPTIMLLGYLGMLREAARADAERRELARTRATAAAAKRDAPPVPAAPVPGPDAEVIDISASLSVAGHKFYDQYADAKQRAVGDLAPV